MKKVLSVKTELSAVSWIIPLVLIFIAGSCSRGLPGSLVILDPILPVIAPDAASAMERQGRKTLVLPYEASESLYAILGVEAPSVLFLSPLLAPELYRILESTPGMKVVYLGSSESAPKEGLFSARFSSVDAAVLAGSVLANQAQTLPDDALCVGIFMNGSEGAAEHFVSSYQADKPGNKPIIEYIATSWSAATANRLKALDVRQAFIAIPGKDALRWAREVFTGSSFVLVESNLGIHTDPQVDALLVWDIDSSLKMLVDSLGTSTSASIKGIWRLLER